MALQPEAQLVVGFFASCQVQRVNVGLGAAGARHLDGVGARAEAEGSLVAFGRDAVVG